MPDSPQSDTEIKQLASTWLSILLNPSTDVYRLQSAFYAWIGTSTRHVRAFLAAFHAAHGESRIDRYKLIEIRQLIDQAPTNVTAFRPRLVDQWPPPEQASALINDQKMQARAMNCKRSIWAGTGAVLVLGLIAFVWSLLPPHATSYRTKVGEQMTLILADGSTVTLNTNTVVEVSDFMGKFREIRMAMGEALINPKHDSEHPFRVRTPTAVLEDIGTRFDVRVERDSTTVFVSEGQVDGRCTKWWSWLTPSLDKNGASVPLHVGDVATFRARRGGETAVRHLSPLDLQRRLSWTEGKLWLSGETLGEAAAEFNRYNERQIVISPEVQDRQVGGIFSVTDPDAFIAAALNKRGHLKIGVPHTGEDPRKVIRLEPAF